MLCIFSCFLCFGELGVVASNGCQEFDLPTSWILCVVGEGERVGRRGEVFFWELIVMGLECGDTN
jgi:hypothetical protein